MVRIIPGSCHMSALLVVWKRSTSWMRWFIEQQKNKCWSVDNEMKLCVFILCRPTVMSATHKMAAAVTSFLLVLLTTLCSHVNGDTVPRPRCPIVCECDRSRVDCNSRDITEIPQLPISTEIITMERNNMTRIRARSFSEVPNLKEITLRHNNIRSIDERAFEGLGLLRKLTLHEDLLSFESGVFRFFVNLTFLEMDLRNVQCYIPQREICRLNQLQQLTLTGFLLRSMKFERCFEDLTQLRVLKLFSMNLGSISGATFRSFRIFLVELYLNHCQLRTLDVDTFKDLSKLTVLSLKKNPITYLADTIFTSLTRLTYLDISKNKLTVISDTLLRPLRNLEYLFFDNPMNLMNLTLGDEFRNMTRLRNIDVSGKIQSLNTDTFRHLRNCPITDISFYECDISRIDKNAFLPLRNITSLSFSWTPFLTSSALHDACYGLNGSSLRGLYLTDVNLNDYTAALFEGLDENSITSLMMALSRITVIKKGMFRNLGTVSTLMLCDNDISKIENDAFKELVMLSTLRMDG